MIKKIKQYFIKKTLIKVATNIETDLFYSIVEFLKQTNWKLISEYSENMFDKGIDFDLYDFKKGREIILMHWNNWEVGEIKASINILDEIEAHFKTKFSYGKPSYLRETIITKLIKKIFTPK